MRTQSIHPLRATHASSELLEALEQRVAPAVLFMATDGSIKDSSGKAVAADPSNSIVGAENALLLKSGDRLVLDADNNLQAGKSEKTLFSVSKGAAVLYLSNLPGGLPMDIAGVAVTGAFKGASGADIFGDIASVLTAQGRGKSQTFLLSQSGQLVNLVPGTGIEGLSVNGFVDGSIVSGGKLSKVLVTGANPMGLGVVGLRAGSGANDLSTLDLGGRNPLSFGGFSAAEGAAGAAIQDVVVLSTSAIVAGDGSPGSTSAGVGGAISKISILNQGGHDLLLKSGSGAALTAGKSGAGKSGGNISDITIAGSTKDLTVITGSGGSGDSASDSGSGGSGAAGGSILGLRASLVLGDLKITTGAGGDAGSPSSDQTLNKPGGAGGSIKDLSVYSGGASVGIQLGNSGTGGGSAQGGSLQSATFGGMVSDLSILAGNGGDSTQGLSGSAGGSITGLLLDAEVTGTLKLVAGNGGATSAIFDSNQGNLKAVGSGGDGGTVDYRTGPGSTIKNLYLQTGDAGSGAGVGSAGMAFGFFGGRSSPAFFGATGDVTLVTGHGADGAKFASSGGSLQNLQIQGTRVFLATGEGGAAGAIDGFRSDLQISKTAFVGGGNGGFIQNVRIWGPPSQGTTVQGPTQEVSLTTGAGGDASSAISWRYDAVKDKLSLINVMDGGDAGFVDGIFISDGVSLAASVGDFSISTGSNVKNAPRAGGGDGGQQDPTSDASGGFRQAQPRGNGGDGGGITNVKAAVQGDLKFTAADGGRSGNMLFPLKSKFGSGPRGGEAGGIALITIQGFAGTSLEMTAGNGGTGLGQARDGGEFRGVQLNGEFTSVALTAGDGAAGRRVDFAGFETTGESGGGNGGRFNNSLQINANVASLELTAGNGGAAADGSLLRGGGGGDVVFDVKLSNVSTLGDVTIKGGNGGAGGAGPGGAGGSIKGLDLRVSGQVRLESGANAESGPGRPSGGTGAGSEIVDVTLRASGDSADVTLISSDGFDEANGTWAGSSAYPSYGTGDSAGGISKISLAQGSFAGVTIQTGKGGDGAISGGNGGLVTAISLASEASVDSFVIKAGGGGDGTVSMPANLSKSGTAGNGGSVLGENFSLLGVINSLLIEAGDGGDSLTGIGGGGKGGDVSKIASILASGGSLQLKAGAGGSAGGNPLRFTLAGNGGSLQDIVVSGLLPDTLISVINLQAGVGGDALGSSTVPGSGGSIAKIASTTVVSESVDFLAGDGGAALQGSSGGRGGDLRDITAIYLNSGAALAGTGGVGMAPGEDGTQTNVVLTEKPS